LNCSILKERSKRGKKVAGIFLCMSVLHFCIFFCGFDSGIWNWKKELGFMAMCVRLANDWGLSVSDH